MKWPNVSETSVYFCAVWGFFVIFNRRNFTAALHFCTFLPVNLQRKIELLLHLCEQFQSTMVHGLPWKVLKSAVESCIFCRSLCSMDDYSKGNRAQFNCKSEAVVPVNVWLNLCIVYTVYLHENFRQYSRGNAESANLKMIWLLIKYYNMRQFKKTSVEVLLDCYSQTAYH